ETREMSKPAFAAPGFSVEKDGANIRIALSGAWTIAASRALEQSAEALDQAAKGARHVAIDFAGVTRLDTAGAWLIDKARTKMAAAGAAAEYAAVSQDQNILLR